jgi:hypothetical protein
MKGWVREVASKFVAVVGGDTKDIYIIWVDLSEEWRNMRKGSEFLSLY